jgi:hypothetical protein
LQRDAEDEVDEQAISAGSQQMRDRMVPGDIRLERSCYSITSISRRLLLAVMRQPLLLPLLKILLQWL